MNVASQKKRKRDGEGNLKSILVARLLIFKPTASCLIFPWQIVQYFNDFRCHRNVFNTSLHSKWSPAIHTAQERFSICCPLKYHFWAVVLSFFLLFLPLVVCIASFVYKKKSICNRRTNEEREKAKLQTTENNSNYTNFR